MNNDSIIPQKSKEVQVLTPKDTSALTFWETAKQAIQQATSIDEVKNIRDKSQAFRAYVKQQKESLEVQNNVAEIKLRCEKRIGEMIRDGESFKHGGDRKSKSHDATLKLDDVGITKSNSSRWQAIARLQDDEFEQYIEDVKKSNEELTTVGIVRYAKQLEKQEEIEDIKSNKVMVPDGQYRTIVIDPPWQMKKINRDVSPTQVNFEYPTMDIQEIKDFLKPEMVADDAHIYLWTTQKYLPKSFDILETWGFNYVFTMVWHKNGGFQPFNLPQYNCEFVLFGKKGNLPFMETKNFFTCFNADRTQHSSKPDEFYELVKRVSPAPRIDIFSRKKRDGFDQLGNETDKFSQD